MQKGLNRLTCHFGCGLGWAEGSTSSIVFTMWHQCALMGGHIGATWRIQLNRPSAAAMHKYFDHLLYLITSIIVICVFVICICLLSEVQMHSVL